MNEAFKYVGFGSLDTSGFLFFSFLNFFSFFFFSLIENYLISIRTLKNAPVEQLMSTCQGTSVSLKKKNERERKD